MIDAPILTVACSKLDVFKKRSVMYQHFDADCTYSASVPMVCAQCAMNVGAMIGSSQNPLSAHVEVIAR